MLEEDGLSVLLLLTCCVDPKGMAYTVINDRDTRTKQYYEAFDFYLENTPYKILIVENTLFDIDEKYLNNDRVEYLTFNGNDFDKTLGKGYGEALILEHAIKNSVLIKENPNVKIAKITGRLKILNLKILLQQVLHTKKDETVYADTNWKLTFVYSYFFVANVNFLSNFFLSNKNEINDTKGVYFEHVLQNAIRKYKKKGFNFKCFKKSIKVKGISASTGNDYLFRNSIISAYKQKIKYLINLF